MRKLKLTTTILITLFLTVGCSNLNSDNSRLDTINNLELQLKESEDKSSKMKELNDVMTTKVSELNQEKQILNGKLEKAVQAKEEIQSSLTILEEFPEVYEMNEEIINYLVDEAIEVCMMINVGMLFDYNSIKEVDGIDWCISTDPDFSSMKELEEYFLSIFVEDIVYDHYKIKQIFKEFDGVLYTNHIGECGSLINYSDKPPKLLSINLQDKKLVYGKEYFDASDDTEGQKAHILEVEIVYVEGKGFRLNSIIDMY